MNPGLSEKVVVRAYERDPASAAAEYGAEFRADIEQFVSREVIDAAVVPDRFELGPTAGLRYIAFVDPSGGSADEMIVCVAHAKGERIIIDAIRAVKPPFSPDAVTADFARLLKSYNIRRVVGDRYAGEWPRERFRAHGIHYDLSEKPKSDLYRESLPLLNAGRVELLDHPQLIAQFLGLERRTARGGRDSIDHGPHGADDRANCVAGALCLAAGSSANEIEIKPFWSIFQQNRKRSFA